MLRILYLYVFYTCKHVRSLDVINELIYSLRLRERGCIVMDVLDFDDVVSSYFVTSRFVAFISVWSMIIKLLTK